MEYISLEEVLYLHDIIIAETGGAEGIRDFGLLHSAIERPKASFAGRDLYFDVSSKAASLLYSLILNHPFIDGNKRTAIACFIRFLDINGIVLKTDQKQLIDLVLRIERKKMTIKDVISWFKKQKR